MEEVGSLGFNDIPQDRDSLLRELLRLEIEYRKTVPYMEKVGELDEELSKIKKDSDRQSEGPSQNEMKGVGCGCLIYLVFLGPWIHFGWFVPKWLTEFANYVGFWQFSVGLFLALGILRLIMSVYIDKRNNEKAHILQTEINEQISIIQKIIEDIPNNFLPAQFRSYIAVCGMIDLVSSYRADTLKEAMNLYIQENVNQSMMIGINDLQLESVKNQLLMIQAIKVAEEARNEANQVKWENRLRKNN